MKSTLIFFSLLLASIPLFAQNQATDTQSENIAWEITHFDNATMGNDSIQQLAMFLMQEYKEAEALRKKGIIVKDIGWVLFVAGPVWVAGDYVKHEGKVCLLTYILAGAHFLAGNVMIPTGYVFKGKGTHRMKFLTDRLNLLDYSEAFSIQIRPTLMQCETPQAQNNIGMGVSVNIGF